MDNFTLDFGYLNSVINPDKSKVVYKGNEERFVRVAFDLFKMKDNSCEDLWQIQADDDGVEYLVRTYEADDKEVIASDWSVGINKTASHLTVSYKGMPVHRLDTKDYGVENPFDALVFRDVVQEKLANNKDFVAKLANELPQEKHDMLVEMGAIDPASKAKSPEDFAEPYHGPGFQPKDPADHAEKAIDITEQKSDYSHAISYSIRVLTKHISKMEDYLVDVSDLYEVLETLRGLKEVVK